MLALSQPNGPGLGAALVGMAWRIAGAVALPLFVAAYLTSLLGPDAPSWAALLVILAGLAVAGAGMYLVLRGMLRETPEPPVSDRARAAGRRWDAEIAERQRRREAGEEDDE